MEFSERTDVRKIIPTRLPQFTTPKPTHATAPGMAKPSPPSSSISQMTSPPDQVLEMPEIGLPNSNSMTELQWRGAFLFPVLDNTIAELNHVSTENQGPS
jgi:hypothetical protein